MSQQSKESLENEFIGVLIAALQKGMTTDDFFYLAESTLNHLRGRKYNDTIDKIINETASPDEVVRLVESLGKKSVD